MSFINRIYILLISFCIFINNAFAQNNSFLEIQYASTSPAETLDIYLPNSNLSHLPVVVFIGNNQWSAPIINKCIEKGYIAVNLGYRNAKDILFPAQIQDIQAALKWLKANHNSYKIDPNKIILCGSSEGGYLAALVAAIGSYEDGVMAEIEFGKDPDAFKAQNLLQNNVNWINLFSIYPGSNYIPQPNIVRQNLKIAGVIDFYGYAYNMRDIDMLNSNLNKKEAKEQTSITTYLTPCTPPMLFIYGDNDKIAPIGIGENIYNKLRTLLCPPGTKDCSVKFISVPNGVHGGMQYESDYIYNSMFDFIESILK